MAETTSEEIGCLGYALGIPTGLALLGLLIQFVQWLWGVICAVALWLFLAPGRLLAWILSWPLFSGHLLIGLICAAVAVFALVLALELMLQIIWPQAFLHASRRAARSLQGRIVQRGEEILRIHQVPICDHSPRTASVGFLRCRAVDRRNPERGICLEEIVVENIPIEPANNPPSRRWRTLRQPTRTYLESLERAGLQPLESDGIEAKAWRALEDSAQELDRLYGLRQKAEALLEDTRRVGQLSDVNELLLPTRRRCRALAPKLESDLEKIEQRVVQLNLFGFKLQELLRVPRSLRAIDTSDDIEDTLLMERGLSDDLYEEIALIEESYGDLMQV